MRRTSGHARATAIAVVTPSAERMLVIPNRYFGFGTSTSKSRSMQPSVMMVRSLSSSTTGPTASWLLAAMMPEKKSIFSTSFIRLTSFTEASGPAASSAVIVSIRRRPRSPPVALISSEARVCPLTGVSGTRPRGDSWAAGAVTSPRVTAPTVTPSEARNVRRSTVVLMGVPLPGRRGSSPHRHVDRVNAIPPCSRLRAPLLVGGAALEHVGSRRGGRPVEREALPRVSFTPGLEPCFPPGGAAIDAHVHPAHRSRAPRPAFDRARARSQRVGLGGGDDHRVDVEVANGHDVLLPVDHEPAVVETRREEALGSGVGEVDARHPLDGVGPEEARHHRADGKAVLGGEGGAVHLPGEEDGPLARHLEGNVLDVAIARRPREGAVVGRFEPQARGPRLRTRLLQERPERRPPPRHVAHPSRGHLGLHRVAEAFEYGLDGLRGPAQELGVREAQRALDGALDPELPPFRGHMRNAHVGDDVHALGWREKSRELGDGNLPAVGLGRIHS